MTADTPSGRITIATRAIATIASQAALRSYGVVGMSPKNLANEIVFALAHDPRLGVNVRCADGLVHIDLFIVIEYGTRISSVSDSVANTVRYQVERALGMPIGTINVHVQDLRISNVD